MSEVFFSAFVGVLAGWFMHDKIFDCDWKEGKGVKKNE